MTSNVPLKRRRSKASNTPQLPKVQSITPCITSGRTNRQVRPESDQSLGEEKRVGTDPQSKPNTGDHYQDEDLYLTRGRPALYTVEGCSNSSGLANVISQSIEEGEAAGSREAGLIPFPVRCRIRSTLGKTSEQSGTVNPVGTSRYTYRKIGPDARAINDSPPGVLGEITTAATSLDRTQWTGKGCEDRMTERAIKDGYSEKPPVAADTLSAKPSLWPHVKNSGGLACLGAFFTDILAARQKAGDVTTPSTFKPPPRVTLTDAKREAWLRDLSDANVPLKRLSRAIPHGLRGRALLDQCLIKKVPVERAVWLAKCVGCSELRASRRSKSLSADAITENETRWTLEWTLTLESFNLDCINSTDQPDWKDRLAYAFQLSSSLFAHDVLTEDHFQSWLLDNLETCPLRAIMVWMTFASSYSKSILRNISLGRHLARTVVMRITELAAFSTNEACSGVKVRLCRLFGNLCTSSPLCVLTPESFTACKALLQEMIPHQQPQAERLIFRNQRIADALSNTSSSISTKTGSIIALLDSLSAPYVVARISTQCMQLVESPQSAMLQLLRWASTIYCLSLTRKYLAISIILSWAASGLDATQSILHAVPSLDNLLDIDTCIIGSIVAELARNKVVDVAIVLRCIISTGAISRMNCDAQISCFQQIVLDLPTSPLSASLSNTRRMLLLSSGISVDQDTKALQRLHFACNDKVSAMTRGYINPNAYISPPDCTDLTCGSVFILASHLLEVAPKLPNHTINEDKRSANTSVVMFVLQTLIGLKDFCALVDYCHIVTKLENMDLLICVTAILNEHLNVILAIPRGFDLPRTVLDQYCVCRATCPPSRMVVEPLLDIFARMEVQGRIAEYLEHEMVLWNQTLAVMACSPLSDFQPETVTLNASLLDELESIVAQNPVLDDGSTKQVLATLSSRLQELEHATILDKAAMTALLNRVRTPLVNHVTQCWLHDQLVTGSKSISEAALLHLIQVGCISMECLDNAGSSAYETVRLQDPEAAAMVAATVLEAMLGSPRAFSDAAADTFPASPHTVRLARTVARVLLVRDAAIPEAVFSKSSFVTAFSYMLVGDQNKLEDVLDVDVLLHNQSAVANISVLALALLDPVKHIFAVQNRPGFAANKHDQGAGDTAYTKIIDQALCTVDTISSPVYHFALSCLTKVCAKRDQGMHSLRSSVVRAVEKAMTTDSTCWLQLLSVLDGATLCEIAHNATARLLSEDNTVSNRIHLDVVRTTAAYLPEDVRLQSCADIIDRLASFLPEPTTTNEAQMSTHTISPAWLESLLELALINHKTLLSVPEGSAHRESLLIILSRLMTQSHRPLPGTILDFTFDVAAIFVDNLPTGSKDNIRASLGDLASHPRIRFLFGFTERLNGWLYTTNDLADGVEFTLDARDEQTGKQPYISRSWDMLGDSTPNVGNNDTAVSLSLFGGRRM